VRERVSATLREGFVQLEGHFRCQAGELRQDFRLLRVLPANYRVVLGSQLDGEGRARGFAQGSMTAITIPRPAAPGSWDGAQFRGAFDDGVARGLSLLAIGAGFAVWLTVGAWRRGLAAWGLLLGALAAGSWFQAPPLAPAAILLLGAIGVAVSARPPLVLALIVGGALGAFANWHFSQAGLQLGGSGESYQLEGATISTLIKTRFLISDLLKATSFVFVMALIVGLYPASRITRLQPAEALRRT